jgi:hypothetical protein
VIEVEDSCLAQGFHLFEADNGFRWTDGDASIPLDVFGDMTGPVDVMIDVGATARYLDEGPMRLAA